MTVEREALRDWHRLFGLLLTDYFTGTPFTVEVERDLSQQQQLLDVIIIRRSRRRFNGVLPDGLADLAGHNLITFKSHHEALDDWAIRELCSHYVAYRKMVSPSTTNLLPEKHFRLYAVCARFPHNLSNQVPWRQRQAGVYDCHWGLDTVRVVVAGELSHEAHNAPLQLFSASRTAVDFAGDAYQRRSEKTSRLLGQLLERFKKEGFAMAYTMEDFERQYAKDHPHIHTPEDQEEELRRLRQDLKRMCLQELLTQLSTDAQEEVLQALPEDAKRVYLKEFFPQLSSRAQEEVLQSLPLERRLAGLSAEQIQQYLDQRKADRPAAPRKSKRKK